MSKLRIGSIICASLMTLSACAQPGEAVQKMASPEDAPVQRLVTRIQGQLVKLPPGTFEMGDWGNEQGLPYDAEPDSKPLHVVTLDGFAMMAYKVTYEDFDVFTEAVGSPKINLEVERFKPGARNAKRPATVNWFGAKAFCQWIGRISGKPFDLPTEAQWEYAARSGGKKLIFATDNGNVDEGRNYPKRWGSGIELTPEIGFYPPNPSGLYGMLDYAATEWVNDWYQPDYYKHSPPMNPPGPERGAANEHLPAFGPRKVVRGLIAASPAFGGFTFSRAGRWPYTRELSTLRKVDRLVTEPDAGYSNPNGPGFRCAMKGSALERPRSDQ
jgi:sulfatase modifying factor 1